jgi:hypothetical protein
MEERFFFHSFARGKKGEGSDETFERSLRILKFMTEVGLVLAPELVKWTHGNGNTTDILQVRACFTELSVSELPRHSEVFGPISLSFSCSDLRNVGIMPVIYSPQKTGASDLGGLGSFLVIAAYHTQHSISKLEELDELSTREGFLRKNNLPLDTKVADDPIVNLVATQSKGPGMIHREVASSSIRGVMDYMQYDSIPFTQCYSMLSMIMNLFYPTDNEHSSDELGYYRQREWRIIGANAVVNDVYLGRDLSDHEKEMLLDIDRRFWSGGLMIRGQSIRRVDLAKVYAPLGGGSLLELAKSVHVHEKYVDRVAEVLGGGEKITLMGTA